MNNGYTLKEFIREHIASFIFLVLIVVGTIFSIPELITFAAVLMVILSILMIIIPIVLEKNEYEDMYYEATKKRRNIEVFNEYGRTRRFGLELGIVLVLVISHSMIVVPVLYTIMCIIDLQSEKKAYERYHNV